MSWEAIGALTAVAPGVAYGVKKGQQWYKDMLMKRREEKELIKNVMECFPLLAKKVDEIGAELKPNGGSSLRDQMNRIETRIGRMEHRQLYTRHASRVTHERLGMMYFEADAAGNWVEVSNGLSKTIDCRSDRVLGRNWTSLIAQHEREAIAMEWDRCVEERLPFNVSTSIVGCDGKEHKVHITTTAVAEEGIFAGFIGEINEVN